MMKIKNIEFCTSCNTRLVEKGFVRFPCPHCGETIARCVKCRELAVIYKCPKCGYEGP
ncbi:zinc finger domain-containing protein [Candidatus Methanoliparum sp. LAM-1]|nr:zinc finger domain-containing protein [Candidatus Methanoliparum sp. LAM-1]BDC35892.1 RNA-binding protein [Candidatus Methanoliparum sp. LAM-1]